MIELRLIHDGRHWVADNESITAQATTLAGLDQEVARLLRLSGSHRGVPKVDVRMTFDRSVIPQWIRQYSGHYFNRIVELDLLHT